MENIYSYIKNRGDVSFVRAPLNEADSVVFCVLCYLDLSEVVPAPGDGEIGLYEAARRYFKIHGIPKTADDDGTCSARSLQRVLLRMAMSPRYREMMLSSYTDKLIADPDGGLPGGEFGALAVRWMPGHVYIALRGTSDRLLGWKEDFHLMTTGRIPSQKEAVKYLKQSGGEAISGLLFSDRRPFQGRAPRHLCFSRGAGTDKGKDREGLGQRRTGTGREILPGKRICGNKRKNRQLCSRVLRRGHGVSHPGRDGDRRQRSEGTDRA